MAIINKKNKCCLVFLILSFSLLLTSNGFGQSSQPVRTEWRSPDGSKPMTYKEWKARWDTENKEIGGEIKYHSQMQKCAKADSFVFGEDYAYYKGYVRHNDNSFCEDLPPVASFIVLLNGNDNKILTDDSPRWAIGDANISGMGWYGIELGNFSNPEVAVGDSFKIIFSCYNETYTFEQGEHADEIWCLPLLAGFPTTLQLQPMDIPLPPDSLYLQREEAALKISWDQKPGLKYTVYRRCLNDTLALNYPRYQYDKIAVDIVDSIYYDITIDTNETYGYILFSEDESTHLVSGRSREINEKLYLNNVRAIFVQPQLYSSIENTLSKTINDWENEGAEVVVYSMQFDNHQALRNTLRSIEGLQGALLIGDFPVPWYQATGYNEDDSLWHYQEYPADIYYMDLDGTWQDNYKEEGDSLVLGTDGIYDTHIDDFPRNTEAPEIVIGRIIPTSGMGDPSEVICSYLQKCHDYRHDLNGVRQEFKALAYPDDDWHTWGNEVANDYISLLYPDYLSIYDINQTTGSDYGSRLDDGYSLIHVWVHSWEQGHAFKINDGAGTEYFTNTQILLAEANANFYNLFACGNSRYIADMNCGAVYALLTESGINTIGTTHSGGMTDFDYFYTCLAQGISYGEAFLKTFQYKGEYGFTTDAKGWYYGLVFNGDPFIIPKPRNETGIAKDDNNHLPKSFNLGNYPNPFNPATTTNYSLPASGKVELTIYNMLGQKIRSLINRHQFTGQHKIIWEGKNDQGIKAPSGIYIYRLTSSKSMISKKMVLIK